MLISIVGVQSIQKNKNSTLVVTGAEIPPKLIQQLADKLKINILFNQPELSKIDTYNPSDTKTTLTLSIVWFQRLPYQDTLHLMAHSKWVVGSGDGSLGELIVTSYYRSSPPLPILFLYDFKRAVLEELYCLAKKHSLVNLSEYLSQIMLNCCPKDGKDKLEHIDKVFETLLQYKEENFKQFLNEWKQICKIIYENHNVQKYIKEEFSLYLDENINVINDIIDESIENRKYKKIANQSPLEMIISGDYEEEFIQNCISKYEKSNIVIDDISKLLCLCILKNNEKILGSLLKCNISNLSVALICQGYKEVINLGPNSHYERLLDPFSFALAEKNTKIIDQLFNLELFVYVLEVFNLALINFNVKTLSLLFPKILYVYDSFPKLFELCEDKCDFNFTTIVKKFCEQLFLKDQNYLKETNKFIKVSSEVEQILYYSFHLLKLDKGTNLSDWINTNNSVVSLYLIKQCATGKVSHQEAEQLLTMMLNQDTNKTIEENELKNIVLTAAKKWALC